MDYLAALIREALIITTRRGSLAPEPRGEENQHSKELKSTNHHRKRQHPDLKIIHAEIIVCWPHLAQARSDVVDASQDRRKSGGGVSPAEKHQSGHHGNRKAVQQHEGKHGCQYFGWDQSALEQDVSDGVRVQDANHLLAGLFDEHHGSNHLDAPACGARAGAKHTQHDHGQWCNQRPRTKIGVGKARRGGNRDGIEHGVTHLGQQIGINIHDPQINAN